MSKGGDGSEDNATRRELEDTVRGTEARITAYWEGGSRSASLAPGGTLVIGRGADSNLPISHGSVSRRHAIVRFGKALTIEDLGSSNGVRLRGRRIPPRKEVAVRGGDLVELGPAVINVQTPEDHVPAEAGDLRAEVEAFERKRVEAALEECAGNQTRAAKLLGISRQALVDRLESYGLPRPRKSKRTSDH